MKDEGSAGRSWFVVAMPFFVVLLSGCSDPSAPPGAAAGSPDSEPTDRPSAAVDPHEQFAALPGPQPHRTPAQVVRLVVEAMGRNDDPNPDSGLKTAYNFASPENKKRTGPFEAFRRMVRGPAYRPMLGFEEAEYGPTEVRGDRARTPVILTGPKGKRAVYLFALSRQKKEPFGDCWMTESVMRVPRGRPVPGDQDEEGRQAV